MRSLSIKLTAITVSVIITGLILTPPSLAESPMEKAKRVKAQMASIRRDLEGVTGKYDNNYNKLENLRSKISSNRFKMNKAAGQLKVNQKRLNGRIKALYRYDKATVLDVVLSARSWDDLLVSWDFINRIGSKDAFLISSVKRLRIEIKAAQKELVASEKIQTGIVKEIGGQKDELESGLAKQKRLMAGLEDEIAALDRAPRMMPSSSTGRVSASGWVFPVGSPYSFSDTWGASRGGGARRHKGTDIFASTGTPCYATVGGSVSQNSGGSAGLWVSLSGSDGNTYWYMHLSGFAASGSVSQGQVIGYVGSTGNAAGGSSHCHFEFHPGGGGAVNPYPYLSSASG